MDLAVTYSTDVVIMKKLNACRLYKKLVYPFELTGFSNTKRTVAFEYDSEPSQIYWDFEFRAVTKPHPTVWKIWRKFIKWVEGQNLKYINDVDLMPLTQWCEDIEKSQIVRKKKDKFEIFKKPYPHYRYYEMTNIVEEYDIEKCVGVLVRQTKSGKILKIEEVVQAQPLETICTRVTGAKHTKQQQRIRMALEKSEVLVYFSSELQKNNIAYYILVTNQESTLEEHFVYKSNQWTQKNNRIRESKGFLLALNCVTKFIEKTAKGEIKFISTDKKCSKCIKIKATASRACAPGGKILGSIQSII